MCYASSCNPECGRCKPRRIVRIRCPKCAASCTVGREEYLIASGLPHKRNIIEEKILERGGPGELRCETCGAPLIDTFREAVTPLPCTFSGIVCGYPCGNHTSKPPRSGHRCPNMVPLRAFKGSEVPPEMRPWENV